MGGAMETEKSRGGGSREGSRGGGKEGSEA